MVLNKRTKRITITNFCLGKLLVSETDPLKDQRGSPAYISPDVLSGEYLYVCDFCVWDWPMEYDIWIGLFVFIHFLDTGESSEGSNPDLYSASPGGG